LKAFFAAKKINIPKVRRKMVDPRTCITWLHLSDWHQGLPDYDRTVLLERMLEDIARRSKHDPRLSQVDLVIFSGDIAFSGKQSEYADAQRELIEPLRRQLGEDTVFFFAPGNHDLDRSELADIPPDWNKLIISKGSDRQKAIGDLLYKKKKALAILAPFDNFYKFSAENKCEYAEGTTVVSRTLKRGQASLGVVAINTAFCCNRHKISPADDPKNEAWDYGVLSITERQLQDAIAKVKGSNVRILVMHHPISWMHESEQPLLEQLISSKFDLVLYGHEHLPRFSSVSGNFGDIKFVPAGSAYASRWGINPRYTNAFNFGVIDLPSGEGAIHHRRWAEENGEWQRDERYWPEGIARFLVQRDSLPQNLKYIFEAQRRYKPFHSKRPAKKAEITLKHERTELGGETFLKATVRYKLELYPGPAEKFPFRTQPNVRILRHPSDEVRRKAFTLICVTPQPEPPGGVEPDFSATINLPDSTDGFVTLEYRYQMLEYEDGVWSFVLGRFIDNVRIVFEKAVGYEYEYASLGGFPNLQPYPDGVLKFESLESDAGHLPHQGYMVQWYPASI
jgi:3',5'-cyclic AMP phosphodiesterase CpdA